VKQQAKHNTGLPKPDLLQHPLDPQVIPVVEESLAGTWSRARCGSSHRFPVYRAAPVNLGPELY
ncbi:hypothetical protein, partial [Streptomyces viridochromogenes]|uniref:hypothetical protein n=1 Tax=Streptomyces viridochromogenes TaxID=1938 RepID=UPI0031E1560B